MNLSRSASPAPILPRISQASPDAGAAGACPLHAGRHFHRGIAYHESRHCVLSRLLGATVRVSWRSLSLAINSTARSAKEVWPLDKG
jgi:hypothetical protein